MVYRQLGEKPYIGASCALLEIDGRNIVIDCGVYLERISGKNIAIAPRDMLEGKHIDLIIVTHSHGDHIGALPKMARLHPEAKILMHKAAFDTGVIMLEDALKIASQASGIADPVFSESDLMDLLFDRHDRLFVIDDSNLGEVGSIEDMPDWLFGFYSAGHDPGAISAYIQPPKSQSVVITGDIASHDQEIVPGATYPSSDFMAKFLVNGRPILITEGTNGAKYPNSNLSGLTTVAAINQHRQNTREVMLRYLAEVRARNGQALYPLFAKGRASNILLMLISAGIVPHVDGMARRLMRLEIPNLDELLAAGKVIFFEESSGAEAWRHREAYWQGGCCGQTFSPVLTASATLDGGYSVSHARYMLPNPKNAIIFTGYMFPNSVSTQVSTIDKGKTLNLPVLNQGRVVSVPVNVRAEVRHYDFTGHDYCPALVDRIQFFEPDRVIIHHSDDSAYAGLLAEMSRRKMNLKVQRGTHNISIVL